MKLVEEILRMRKRVSVFYGDVVESAIVDTHA